MDVITRDFSLNFRGFEHEDPETVRRFCAFCEANFDLLPEQAERLATKDETIVLTHSNSPEELEALAKVLREIGARVEVSADGADGMFDYEPLPTTQELHRLFQPESETADPTARRATRIAPIGSSLYLVNPSLASTEHAEILRRRKRPTLDAGSAHVGRRVSGVLTGVALVLVGATIGAIVGALAFHQRESTPEWSKAPQSMLAAPAASHARKPDTSKTLAGSVEASGYRVEVKATIGSSTASIRSFIGDVVAPLDTDSVAPRHFEGDPAFLEKSAEGEWSGTLTFYTFQRENGEEVRTQRQARVKLIASRDPRSASAQFTVIPLIALDSENDSNRDALPLSNLTVTLGE